MHTRKPLLSLFQLVPLFVALIAAPAAFTQSATATLSGDVVDEQRAVVPRATVTLISTGISKTATSNDTGYFTFSLLRPGRYTVRAEREGFATAEFPNLILNVNDHSFLKIPLKIRRVEQSVDVIDRLSIQNQSAFVSTLVDRQFANELPLNGRSFDSLIRLTPGTAGTVAGPWELGQFSFNGQRPNANYVMVDGVGANVGMFPTTQLNQNLAGTSAPVSALGGTNSLVPVDALEEFRIETSSYAPEFGRAPGAQISIVTRAGGNDFHGTAFEYFRNDVFDANDWFANAKGLARPTMRQNDFGGVLGGPILRNRTFFFASFEGLRLRLPHVAASSLVPSLSLRQNAPLGIQPLLNAFPVPNGSDFGDGTAEFSASYSNPSTVNTTSIRIDHTVNSRLSLFGRYNIAPSSAIFRNSALSESLSVATRSSFRTETGTFGATVALGSAVTNDFRFNYSRVKGAEAYPIDSFGRATPPPAPALFPAFLNPAAASFQMYFLDSSELDFGPSSDNRQRQLNIVNNLSFHSGPHSLRFGVDYRRLSPIYNPPQSSLFVEFDNESHVLSGIAATIDVKTDRPPLYPTFKTFSAYAQDAWRIRRRLTLTYGLRWELNPPPGEAHGNMPYTVSGLDNLATVTLAPKGTPLFDTTYHNVAPRVGAAYLLFGSPHRETILRGGFGVFYDLGTGPSGSAFGNLTDPSKRLSLSNAQYPLPPDSVASPVGIATPYPSLTIMDPHLALPRTYEWNVAIEQSLGGDQSVSVSYVGAAGRQLLRQEYVDKPNQNFKGIFVTRNNAASDYHALQIQFQRRLSRGLQSLASYTWSHSMDNDSSETDVFQPAATLKPGLDRGPSDFDIRHSFSAAATYDLPHPFTNGMLRPIFRSWAVDVVFRTNSAPPVSAIALNLVPGIPVYINDPAAPGGRRINRAAFSSPAANTPGNLGRNALRAFPISQADTALLRQFTLRERLKLQLRAEAFNVLNHPNFGPPGTRRLTAPGFGLSQNMLNQSIGTNGAGAISHAGLNPLYQIGGPRSIQLSVKLRF